MYFKELMELERLVSDIDELCLDDEGCEKEKSIEQCLLEYKTKKPSIGLAVICISILLYMLGVIIYVAITN